MQTLSKQYQCYACDGTGEISFYQEADKNGQPIFLNRNYKDCKHCDATGRVDRDTLKQQLFNDFPMNNLELIELFEERKVD